MIVVAPFAGAWIEITVALFDANEDVVAPFAGAWIEISVAVTSVTFLSVAPFAGAWIEILNPVLGKPLIVSLRSPERGLKLTLKL